MNAGALAHALLRVGRRQIEKVPVTSCTKGEVERVFLVESLETGDRAVLLLGKPTYPVSNRTTLGDFDPRFRV